MHPEAEFYGIGLGLGLESCSDSFFSITLKLMQDDSIGDTSYTLITIYMYLLRILISEHLSKSNQNFTYPFKLPDVRY